MKYPHLKENRWCELEKKWMTPEEFQSKYPEKWNDVATRGWFSNLKEFDPVFRS